MQGCASHRRLRVANDAHPERPHGAFERFLPDRMLEAPGPLGAHQCIEQRQADIVVGRVTGGVGQATEMGCQRLEIGRGSFQFEFGQRRASSTASVSTKFSNER